MPVLACPKPSESQPRLPPARPRPPQVHRLLMADSGTLLLCSVDKSGNLARLRARLRGAFPGAPSTQSSIMHASVARLLSPRQLTVAQIARVQVRRRLCSSLVAGRPSGALYPAAGS